MNRTTRNEARERHLKPNLESIDGFIDNERFESKRHEGSVLSISTWRDEKAVVRWRSQSEHHGIQEQGRNGIFDDYHLRVCEVTAHSKPPAGLHVIEQRLDATEIGQAKALAITEVSSAPNAVRPAVLSGCEATSGFLRTGCWITSQRHCSS